MPVAITVHITVPRRLWTGDPFHIPDDDDFAIIGRFVKTAAEEGRQQVAQRVNGQVEIKHIEITLTDGVSATVEDDPEAHKP